MSPITFAQQRYIDSLEAKLKQQELSDYEKTVIRCKLTRALFETNPDKAVQLTNDAADAPGADAKAWLYATRIHLLVQRKDKPGAYAAMDSAMRYVNSAKDPVAKGMVWFRSGWLDLIDNENDEAVAKFLKALDNFKGRQGLPMPHSPVTISQVSIVMVQILQGRENMPAAVIRLHCKVENLTC
ncbi:hypothetical protein [Chitinophaga pinensis]|uniref:hypothetical protein n=1 Tax=Chitinophaga pinensis TaxID=79329 RepID=UPI001C9928EC|nr:hypothetical protein [Chitinophaga pinensis]